MHFKLNAVIHASLNLLLDRYPLVQKIVHSIAYHNGRTLLVGGAVRDLLLNLPVKDLDIEVYGISLADLEKILQHYGYVRMVGKAFGVLRIDGLDVDWSLPRIDSQGRKPTVLLDPSMAYQQAFVRRDLTINAMGIDLKDYTLIDPFNGQYDLQQLILRTPDIHFFAQDPLRLFRVMQFVGRFNMAPDESLNNVCSSMDISMVSVERKEKEFRSLMLKSERPSLGIRWLQSIDRLKEIAPELHALINVPQRADYHPEGDVFEHTMQALDAAACIAQTLPDDNEKLILLWSAVCHDLGKATTTVLRDGMWRSHGHAQAGVPLARHMLKKIGIADTMIKTITSLVYHHMIIGEFVRGNARLCRYKHVASTLASDHTTLRMLAHLSMADRRGRNQTSHEPRTADDPEVLIFIQQSLQAGVLDGPEKALLHASDLLPFVQPGPAMGRLLKRAYTMQLDANISNKNELLQKILKLKSNV